MSKYKVGPGYIEKELDDGHYLSLEKSGAQFAWSPFRKEGLGPKIKVDPELFHDEFIKMQTIWDCLNEIATFE